MSISMNYPPLCKDKGNDAASSFAFRKRDIAVDYFKMLATLLVMNSHAEMLYPKYQVLASGGAIGDGLFMFCSGFTLFLGTMGRFDNYYKRRLQRIVPSMVALSVILALAGWFSGNSIEGTTIGMTLSSKNYLTWILLFYIPLFFVRKYFSNKMAWVFAGLTVMTGIAYYFFPYKQETGIKGMWGSLYHDYKWFWYFVIMFWGAYIGSVKDRLTTKPVRDAIMTFLCFIGFYALPVLSKRFAEVAPFQIVMLPLLMGFLFYFYRLLSADVFARFYQKKILNWFILVIGGLCLESYLIHMKLFTDRFNSIFPFNLIIIYVAVLVAAYLLRCISRIILQTFQKEPFNWNAVFKLY